jgi:periplasmic protein TonB
MTMTHRKPIFTSISFLSLLGVLGVHAALLYGMWQHRFSASTIQTVTLYAEFIAPSEKAEVTQAPKVDLKAEHMPPQEKPKPPVKKIQPQTKRQLVANAPAMAQEEFVAPPPPPPDDEPKDEPEEKEIVETVAAASPAQMPTGPVTLSSELSVSCPELARPSYPALSRRLGEEGKLMLKVELDESGRISKTQIVESSGYSRLDNAALSAVKTWRCQPAIQNGQPVRSVALQPFNFVIEGN